MRSLEHFTDSIYRASSRSGWMTKSLFRFFAMWFIAEISHRAHWPKEIRDEPVLLLCDGHPSRWDFKANLLFCLFNIDGLTYPGHCSHFLQTSDVAVANPGCCGDIKQLGLLRLLAASSACFSWRGPHQSSWCDRTHRAYDPDSARETVAMLVEGPLQALPGRPGVFD